MNIARFLLLALVLTPAANAVQLQDKDKRHDTRGRTVDIRPADPRQVQLPRTTASEHARQQRSAEEEARAKRFSPAPRGKPPQASSPSSSGSSNAEK